MEEEEKNKELTKDAFQENKVPFFIKTPTQEAAEGITFDFCSGFRIMFPDNNRLYRILLRELDTGIVVIDAVSKPNNIVTINKKYLINYIVEIYRATPDNQYTSGELVFQHVFDLEGKEVLVDMDAPSIGDTIGWFSYMERFQKQYKCKLTVTMNPKLAPLFIKQYQEITFTTNKDLEENKDYKPYAAYRAGLFFKGDRDNQPVDFRFAGNHKTLSYILNLEDKADIAPRVDLSHERIIKEKYVCIATKASSMTKCWNSPDGWRIVIQYLKDNGYRVLCIDKDREISEGAYTVPMPYGAEDFTGDLPLQDRVNLIKDADLFIGLSSGLSWLAWCCKVPVVLISGFTAETNEFYTPYRIINYQVCNSCWNDFRYDFDHHDFTWCPCYKNTERQFECSRMITPTMVINKINDIPAFKKAERVKAADIVKEPFSSEAAI